MFSARHASPLERPLRYGGLAVSDATGRRLSSRLELRQKRLLLLVDDREATYPLRIDPFIQQGSKLAPAVGEIAATSNFGASVAMSSDGTTALVGAPLDSASDADEGAAWIFVKSNGVWTQLGPSLVPNDADNSYHGADFGESVALSADGTTALIGGPGDGNDAQGAAWVFTRSGGLWIQQGTKLIGSGGGNLAACGTSVALSADGNTALIGCPGESNSTGGVWVFTRAAGTWTQQGPVLGGNDENTADNGPQFGRSVALSSDGNTAIIGGSFDGSTDVGAAWVFTRTNGTWTQQGAKLTASDEVGGGSFGWSVALSADGNTALIGGYSDDSHAGAAWVFTRSGTAWTQQGSKLTGGGESGWSVALSSDGDTALIGAPGPHGPGTASVYVLSAGTWALQSGLTGTGEVGQGFFGGGVALSGDGSSALVGGPQSGEGALWAFTGSGGTWTQQGSPLVALASAEAGYAVALSADGNTALVGGPFGGPDNEGEAWVFTRSGSTWTEEADLTSCDGLFGASVALSADGSTALIGCPDDGGFAGSAWVFTRSGTAWTQQGPRLTGGGEDEGGGGGQFGVAVSLSSDGNTALIGAPFDGSDFAGAAWVFTRSGGAWTQDGSKLTGGGEDESGGGGLFGASVSLSSAGDTALIGAPDDGSNEAGAAWVFTESGGTWTQQGAKLTASGADESGGGSEVGFDVSLSADGSTALVGAPFDGSDNRGAAWVFTRSGVSWSQLGPKLTASDEDDTGGGGWFGFAVALSADGNTALVGGPLDTANVTGAAWLFSRAAGGFVQQGRRSPRPARTTPHWEPSWGPPPRCRQTGQPR